MSSILTNTSAMVALQTLKSINQGLTKTQNEISTGKSVSSAKDNSAIWAISKVMEADVKGFKAISDSLSLGESTVAVARQASETVTDLLTEIKGKIVASQEQNVDRVKINTDITALRDQITTVVNSAQFNGLNLLKGTDAVNVLASLDRSSSGSVSASQIQVDRQNLEATAGTFGTGASLSANVTAGSGTISATGNTSTLTIGGTVAGSDTFTFNVGGTDITFTAATTSTDDVATGLADAITSAGLTGITAVASGSDVTLTSTNAFTSTALTATTSGSATTTLSAATIDPRAETVSFSTSASVAANDSYRVAVGGTNYDYIASDGDTFEDVANGLKAAIDAAGTSGVSTQVDVDGGTGEVTLSIDNSGADLTLAASGAADGVAAGGLAALGTMNVTTTEGSDAALAAIEGLIQTSIDAASSFGSVQGRISIQNEFVGKLSDSLKAGIGTLVDADMEEASARLQALQVQQQLGVQSLSIANQAPQSILSLFR